MKYRHTTLGAAPAAAVAAKPILATVGKIAGAILPGLMTNPWKDLGANISQLNSAADTTLQQAQAINQRADELLKISRKQVNQAVQVSQAVRAATPPDPGKKDHTMTYVLVGTGTLAAIGIGWALLSKT